MVLSYSLSWMVKMSGDDDLYFEDEDVKFLLRKSLNIVRQQNLLGKLRVLFHAFLCCHHFSN